MIDKKESDRIHKTVYGAFGTLESFGEMMVNFETIEINRNRNL